MRKVINRSYNSVMNILKVLSLEMLIVVCVFFLSFFVLIFLIKEVFFEQTFSLDQEAFVFLQRYISDDLNSFMSVLTIFGSHKFLVPANLVLIAYAFFIMRDKWFGIKLTAVSFTSLLLMSGLKWLFGRPRPLEPLISPASGLSFPSGHAFMSFAFFGLLIYSIYKQIDNKIIKVISIVFLLVMVLIICVSRIYLRVHYLSDVMAGLCLGMMWLAISVYVMNRLEKKSKKEMVIS